MNHLSVTPSPASRKAPRCARSRAPGPVGDAPKRGRGNLEATATGRRNDEIVSSRQGLRSTPIEGERRGRHLGGGAVPTAFPEGQGARPPETKRMIEAGAPSFCGLHISRRLEEGGRSDFTVCGSKYLVNDGFGEVLTPHVPMHLRSAFANLRSESSDSGTFMNVASEVHVALIATKTIDRQGECNTFWHRSPSVCVG